METAAKVRDSALSLQLVSLPPSVAYPQSQKDGPWKRLVAQIGAVALHALRSTGILTQSCVNSRSLTSAFRMT